MLLLFGVPLLCLAICAGIAWVDVPKRDISDGTRSFAGGVLVFGGFWFAFCLAVLIGFRFGDHLATAEYLALKSTIESQQKQGIPISAVIQVKAEQMNECLIRARYWNEGLTDAFCVDSFVALPLIEFPVPR